MDAPIGRIVLALPPLHPSVDPEERIDRLTLSESRGMGTMTDGLVDVGRFIYVTTVSRLVKETFRAFQRIL